MNCTVYSFSEKSLSSFAATQENTKYISGENTMQFKKFAETKQIVFLKKHQSVFTFLLNLKKHCQEIKDMFPAITHRTNLSVGNLPSQVNTEPLLGKCRVYRIMQISATNADCKRIETVRV